MGLVRSQSLVDQEAMEKRAYPLDMTINIIDKSGQGRSDEDLAEAVAQVKTEMVTGFGKNQPMLQVMFPTILECLQELQRLRAVIRKHEEDLRAGAGQGRHDKF